MVSEVESYVLRIYDRGKSVALGQLSDIYKFIFKLRKKIS